MSRITYTHILSAAILIGFTACMESPPNDGEWQELRGGGPPAGLIAAGKAKFDKPFSGTNGRACGDCHVVGESRALPPEHVQDLLQSDPGAPLFQAMDADEPAADELSFTNLAFGLARVRLPLPANMDVIDFGGNVVTPADRMIEVWRTVPPIRNTSYTGPYLHDGRAETLEEQALGAIEGHSEGTHAIGQGALLQIAEFERAQFSSDRARFVHEQIEAGVPALEIPNPEDDPAFLATLSPAQRRGKQVYDLACTACHGSATNNLVVDREVHDFLCVEPGPDGNLIFDFTDMNDNGIADLPEELATVTAKAPAGGCGEFLPIGTSFGSMAGQLGIDLPPLPFNSGATLPAYRFRFYRDDARTIQWTDLPPIPVVDEQGNPALDSRGLPIVGPVLLPQPYSTDPGRALISGLPSDFEAFDVPQLRGIADTAPYFHDNLMGSLEDVVDFYSRLVLPFFTPLGLPPVHPTPQPSLFPGESLTADQKADLVEFLLVL